MRVTCNTIEEFLINLQSAEGIHRNTVHVSRTINPYNTTEPLPSAVVIEITFQVSAIVLVSPDEQYLLESGESCGLDHRDADPDTEGSDRSAKLYQSLEDVCEDKGYKIMPGVIHVD